ncbi:uncharacterized protein LOC124138678 [Haliotis rufescens]|uniref:uncharacterized protein LOC124138678 n=1 Tax=Haliotis rufescens TaxID=6454 RepID=UPI00201EB94F|nr:uncharacterized protein LOC124138678 [Haliotis rufescens]
MYRHKHTGPHQKVFTPPGDQRRKVDGSSDGPYSAIAHLTIHLGSNKYVGTGFLFKREAIGKERFVVLTAGHNLYDHNFKRHADAVVVRFGRNGTFNTGEIIKYADAFRVPSRSIQDHEEEYDFGMILLDISTDPIPHEYAFEPMVYADDDSVFAQVFMSGYPRRPRDGKDGMPGFPRGTQWELEVNLEEMTDYHFLYKDATTPGNSGSPVYWKIPILNKYVALGIHVTGGDFTGFNAATRITMETLTEYIDVWLDFDDDDWVYYPWVDTSWLDVDDSERRKTWEKGLPPNELASRAERLGCPAFNTGGAIKTHVMPKAEWFNLFSYDSGLLDSPRSYGMWIRWSHAKCMQ